MTKAAEVVHDIFDVGGRGWQHQGLRRANERAVLTIVGFNQGLSNAEISRLSGLAPQTVSAILLEVEKTGLITRGEVLRGRRGQPATPIFINPDGAYAVGCEIGWRHLDLVLIDLVGNIRSHVRREYDYPDARTMVGTIATATDDLLGTLNTSQQFRVADFGLAMPTGMWRSLDLVDAPKDQAALWRDLDIAAELHTQTGLEVTLFNDGNAACWAELIAYPRPRPADFIYFLVARFVAAGIVGQGQLWEGPTGNSANLGSMLVTDAANRPKAAHFVASISALEQRLILAGREVPTGWPEQWDWDALEPVLSSWITEAGKALAEVAFNTTMVVESNLMILDGIMPKPVLQRLVDCVALELKTLPKSSTSTLEVVAGHLGGIAPALGAAELPLYRRYLSRSVNDLAAV